MLAKRNRIPSHMINTVKSRGDFLPGSFGDVRFLCTDHPRYASDDVKFAFIVSKKHGNAVMRHKIERRMRALSRKYIGSNVDLSRLKGLLVLYIAKDHPQGILEAEAEYFSQLDKIIEQL